MMIEHKSFPFQVKGVDSAGHFEGYLSVFNNVDSYREIVMPGSFKDSLNEWKAQDKLPPVLWQHRSDQPIGPFTKMEEDDHGLRVEGKLLVDDVMQAKEAHALMKNNVISGMSIGFETVGEEMDKENNVRKLTKIKLWEGSIVTFPANPAAQIDAVKSALHDGALPDIKTFERYLRESGFSKSQALIIASKGLSYLLRSESEEPTGIDVASLVEALKKPH